MLVACTSRVSGGGGVRLNDSSCESRGRLTGFIQRDDSTHSIQRSYEMYVEKLRAESRSSERETVQPDVAAGLLPVHVRVHVPAVAVDLAMSPPSYIKIHRGIIINYYVTMIMYR